jgi:transketolase
MNIINERNIKIWSTIGSRATFGMSMLEVAKDIDNLMVLTCDVSTSAGLDRFRKIYPNKYVDLGIAEQNMIGVAAGLASENFNVVTTTFAPFQTMRCLEQIKVNLGYMGQKICMVGIASGLVLGTLGYTHCCIEDFGVLRSIPGMTIISPADSLETVKSVEAAIKYEKPSYIRLTGASNNPTVYDKDYKFEIGKFIKLKEGNDICIIATGSMVKTSLNVAEKLKDKKLDIAVYNAHTIKPIDKKEIKIISKKFKYIFSIEEHNIIGGLGSAISEEISHLENINIFNRIGINDTYSKGGSYQFLKEIHGLSEEKIINTITNKLKK